MAHEELEHVSLLRRERRMAFHAERPEAGPVFATLGWLAATERHLGDLIEKYAECVSDRGPIASLATASKDAAIKLVALEKEVDAEFSTPGVPAGRENDIASLSEYLAEAYLRLAENSRNERMLSLAQELAKSAVYRLSAIAPPSQPRRPEARDIVQGHKAVSSYSDCARSRQRAVADGCPKASDPSRTSCMQPWNRVYWVLKGWRLHINRTWPSAQTPITVRSKMFCRNQPHNLQARLLLA